MARSATPSSGRPGRPGRRPPVKQGKNTLLPVIMGGGAVVVLIIVFALTMGEKDEPLPTDDVKTGTTSSAKALPTPPRAETPPAPSGPNWRELRAQVDMAPWREVETQMGEAMRLRQQALDARGAGNEEEFESLMKQGLAKWRAGSAAAEDFAYTVEKIHPDLYDEGFDREADQLKRWNTAFRGYLHLE